MVAICLGDGVRVRAIDMGGVIESCLKLDERLSSDSSVSSDDSAGVVVGTGVFEVLAMVDSTARRRM
jgi:hypothetical protein